MEEILEQIKCDWKVKFPSEELPNLEYLDSKETLTKKIEESQKRVHKLKISLQKEEYLLEKLLNIAENDLPVVPVVDGIELTGDERKPIEVLNHDNDNLIEPMYDEPMVLDVKALDDVNSEEEKVVLPPTDHEKGNNVSRNHKKSYSMDESQLDLLVSPYSGSSQRRLTDPSIIIDRNIKPVAKPRATLPQKKKPLPPLPPNQSSKNRSSSLCEMTTKSNKNEKTFSSTKSMKSLNELKNLNEEPFDKHNNSNILEEEEGEEGFKPENEQKKEIDPYQDDEHIYADISDICILPKKASSDSECSTSDSDSDSDNYENLILKPKMTMDKSSEGIRPSTLSSRKGILLPSDSDDTFLVISSQESLSANVEKEKETKESSSESDYSDDDHIYANVDDYRIHGDDSDQDQLNDSASIDLSFSHYKEMTEDQIKSMIEKIEHSDDEGSGSQGIWEYEETDKRNALRPRNISNSDIFRHQMNQDESEQGSIGRSKSSPIKRLKEKPEKNLSEEEEHVKADRMRNLLVNNLRDSEKCYIDCLEMLVKFMKPLKISSESSQPILSQADFKSIFHRVDELLELHQSFFKDLEPRVQCWNDGQLIGDLFTLIMHDFDIYLAYIGNYKSSQETITKCRNANEQFALIMDEDFRIPSLKDPLKLEGLLYKPVDRITQYSLILNDLLKYTNPDHPDHPLIVEVSGALFDLFEQVNVDSSKKKRRQRQLLKEASVVEIDDGDRRPRTLILFNDVIISAKLKPSRDAFVCKWYASLCDINIKRYENSEDPAIVPVSSKTDCDKIRANIANMRLEIRKDHMPMQQVVSANDSSPPFVKRRHQSGPRSSSRVIERIKKKISEQERILSLISPSVRFEIYHKNGKCYTMLLAAETEKQAWIDALKPRLKRIHARNPPSIQLSSLELQQAFETVLKVQRLGQRFGAQMPSPFFGPTRPLSMDISVIDDADKESLTGYLFVNIHYGKGFSKNSDTYVVLEMDSYGHFFKRAKTKPSHGSDPQWEEPFDFEIEHCSTLRLSCYNKLRLMGDDVSGKCSINLTRENLLDNRNHTLNLSLDRGQSVLNISLCFSTSIDGIKKSPSFSDTGVFGVPIMVVCKREKFNIPVIVISCIKEIEKRGMDEVGIYRLSGIASEIQNLKKLFNEQTQNALLALTDTDVHAVAGLLKLYFRELPQSLFTSKLYRKFVEGLSITDSEDKEFYMIDILHQLPNPNKMTALYLFEHLRRVVLLEEKNKMGVNNLATVFGPTVLRPPSSNGDKEQEQSSCNVGSFDIGALDVMSQVGIFRYFLGLKENSRTSLPENDLNLWRRLDPERASVLEEKLMETAEEHLI